MKEIDAASLLRCTLESPADTRRTQAVLPFFTAGLETRFLLVVLEDGRCVVTKDRPTGVVSRSLAYASDPNLRRPLARVQPTEMKGLLHFDPWWLLRDRDDIPSRVRKAAMATNLPGREGYAGRIEMVWFDAALAGVTSARIGRQRVSKRRLLEMLEAVAP